MVGVEALGADLFLALQAEQNVVLGMLHTLLIITADISLRRHSRFQQATLRTIRLSHRRIQLQLYLTEVQQVLRYLCRRRLRLDLRSRLHRHLLWNHLLRHRGRKK